MENTQMAKVRVLISIDDSLLERLNTYCKNTKTTRSGAISVSVTHTLLSEDLSYGVGQLALELKQMAYGEKITRQQLQKMKDFHVLARALQVKRE